MIRYLKTLYLFIALITSCIVFAQNKVVYAKHFTKSSEVLLRWAPVNKQIFDVAIKNGYKITRYVKENNNLTSPVVLVDNFKPFQKTDTMKWALLLNRNNNAAIAYKIFCESDNVSTNSKDKNAFNKMFYDMLLFTCDFDVEVARASGLFFKDSLINNTKVYLYKIEVNKLPTTLKYNATFIDVNANFLSENPVLNNLSATVKNKLVTLKWNAYNYKNDYAGYNVERSSDSVNFIKVNKSPVVLVSSQFEKNKKEILFDDTCKNSNVKYFYRIVGINHFGSYSKASNIVSVIGNEPLKSFLFIDTIYSIKNQSIFVSWKLKDEKEISLVKKFIIYRAKKDRGPYQILHQTNSENVFTDLKPEASNYYKIGAISFGNDTIFSFSRLAVIIDSIPPMAPVGLKATVDTKGNVIVTWDKNKEPDLQGYKIYKANALNEEFVQVNNKFTYTEKYLDKLNLKTLTKHIYYKVVATDNNYNNSDFSKEIEVKRPDTIAPIAPIIKDLKLTQDGITINWIPSSSDDVKSCILYHQKMPNGSDVMLKSWSNLDSLITFKDTSLEFGETYKYKIVVLDDDDNINISNTPMMKYETGYRKKITKINYEVNRESKLIKLSWSYELPGVEKYILYRSKVNEPLSIVKTVNSSITSFDDKTVNISNIYEYRIKAVLNNGTESIISDAVKIEY